MSTSVYRPALTVCLTLLVPLACGGVAAAATPAPAHLTPADYVHQAEPVWPLLKDYCTKCHNTDDWAGGVAFDALTAAGVPEEAKTWEAVVRKLRGRLMPPPGNPQPEQTKIDAFSHWVSAYLDASETTPWAGHVPVQRLTRTEYGNAVRGLLAVDVKVNDLLPPETEVEGFDNIAAALSVSPAFLDQYVSAARAVAHIAVGSATPKMSSTFYSGPAGLQDQYVDGMPPGTRGGMSFKHNFPADGEYRVNILDLDVGLYPRAMETRSTVVVLVDSNEVFRQNIGGADDLALIDHKGADGRAEVMKRFANIPMKVNAGTHELTVTFIERARAETDEYVDGSSGGFGGTLRLPRILDGVQVVGPFGATSLSRTASRDRIFVCQPQSSAEEPDCAERIAADLARRAFRRPVTNTDVRRLMPFYVGARKDGGNFDAGVTGLVMAILASPDFLYRGIEPSRTGGVHPLSDIELASRLSFFLWAQGPDEELIRVATSGKLSTPETMAAQVRRMLADPRASSLISRFAFKWLNLDKLDSVEPDPRLFPGYSPQLRQDMATESELFIRSVLLGDHSVLDLLSSNQTFLDERLARHYGIAGISGPQFRQVTLTDERRFGLLGKGAVLMRTSYGDRTSPVLRGAWVLDKLMGSPPSPPPPNTVMDLSNHPGEKPKTIRTRLETHRSNITCNQCHGVIDPLGLALENFDTTGQWRDIDPQAHERIDANTRLTSGLTLNGPVQLRQLLVSRPEQFVEALSEKLMLYALGRRLEYQDMPQVRSIVRAAKQDGYRMSSLVLGIVDSPSFRMQAEAPTESKPVPTKVAAVEAP
ncbi:MAG TPA: DUF1592 domain-containing protein [Steroidobacteraceae bacterium]